MTAQPTPVGASERRHVTHLAIGDLVWDVDLARWRAVTSVLRYTAERTKQDMVKIVLDISAFHRHTTSDDAYYDVLLDDQPHASVRPLTATERRRLTRRGRDEVTDAPTGPPGAAEAAPAGPAAGLATAAGPENVSEQPIETPRAAAGRSVPDVDVRRRREALRLSRNALAELAGLTPGALWRVEDGRPKNDELDRVTAALDLEEAHCAPQ